MFPYPDASYKASDLKNLIWIKRESLSDKNITKIKKTRKSIIKGVLRPNNNIDNV